MSGVSLALGLVRLGRRRSGSTRRTRRGRSTGLPLPSTGTAFLLLIEKPWTELPVPPSGRCDSHPSSARCSRARSLSCSRGSCSTPRGAREWPAARDEPVLRQVVAAGSRLSVSRSDGSGRDAPSAAGARRGTGGGMGHLRLGVRRPPRTHAVAGLLLVPAHAVLVAATPAARLPHGLLAGVVILALGMPWVRSSLCGPQLMSETAWIPYPSARMSAGRCSGYREPRDFGLVLRCSVSGRSGARASGTLLLWLGSWAFAPSCSRSSCRLHVPSSSIATSSSPLRRSPCSPPSV